MSHGQGKRRRLDKLIRRIDNARSLAPEGTSIRSLLDLALIRIGQKIARKLTKRAAPHER